MRKKRVSVIAVLFGVFFLFVYLQHQFVYLYFDDFGYASLSYGNAETYQGMQYSVADVLGYLKWHYLEWGGRVLYYFFGILSMKAGLGCIRLVQSVLILGLSLFSYRLIRDEEDPKGNLIKALVLIFSYAAVRIETVNEGIFWFSASMGYVWPLCPLFAAVYCHSRFQENKDRRYLSLTCVLFFLAAFSYEQTALLTAVYVMLYYGFYWLCERKCEKGNFLVLGAAFLGSGLELLAPGNFVRASDEMNAAFNSLSILEKIKLNLPELLEFNLGYSNRISVLAFLVSGIFCALLLLRKRQTEVLYRYNLAAGAVLAVLVLSTWYIPGKKYLCGVLALWIIWYWGNMTLFLWKRKNWMLFLFYAGLCSQGMMLAAPAVPPRCHIPLEFIMHIVTAYMIAEFLKEYKWKTVYAALGMLMGLAVYNVFSITLGYYRNSDLNRMNDERLVRMAEAVKTGEEPGTAVLYRMRDDRYASQMPYQQQYIEYWVKNYYELPQETIFEWKMPDGITK